MIGSIANLMVGGLLYEGVVLSNILLLCEGGGFLFVIKFPLIEY